MIRSNRQRNQDNSSTIVAQDIETLSQIYDKNSDLQVQDDANDNIGRQSLSKKIRPLVCDITDLQVDAIVCPTQSDLTLEPYGLSKTIQIRGGLLLQQTCKQIGKIEVGKAAITEGYDLNCKYVIHTAGPSPNTLLDNNQSKLCLKRSYRSALKLVRETPNIRTVAFPLLGSGGAGIELTDAIRISTTTLRSWLDKQKNAKSIDSIVLCFNDPNQWEKYFPELIYAFPYGKEYRSGEEHSLESDSLYVSVPSSPVLLPESTTARDVDGGDWSSSDGPIHTEPSSDAVGCLCGLHTPPSSRKSTTRALSSKYNQEHKFDECQMLQKRRKTSESKLDCTDIKVCGTAQERTYAKEIQTIYERNLYNELNVSSITSGDLEKTNIKRIHNSENV